jgi:hypothetical protein
VGHMWAVPFPLGQHLLPRWRHSEPCDMSGLWAVKKAPGCQCLLDRLLLPPVTGLHAMWLTAAASLGCASCFNVVSADTSTRLSVESGVGRQSLAPLWWQT